MAKKLLLFNIIFVFLFACSYKKNIEENPKPQQNVLKKEVVIEKKKDETIDNDSFLSELKFQKDSLYFINYNIDKKLVLIDEKTQNGFLRKYYCGNKLIDSLKVEENKIKEGLFLNGKIKKNELLSLISLATFKNYKKNGYYVEFDEVSGISLVGNYKDDKKESEWLYYYTNGKWSGKVCIEKYNNNVSIEKECDYYDWDSKLNTKLKKAGLSFNDCLKN